jgi:hypothetical protein
MNIIMWDKSYKNICACTYMSWCAKCGYYILFATTQPPNQSSMAKSPFRLSGICFWQ